MKIKKNILDMFMIFLKHVFKI